MKAICKAREARSCMRGTQSKVVSSERDLQSLQSSRVTRETSRQRHAEVALHEGEQQMIELSYRQTNRNQMAVHGFYTMRKRDLQILWVKSRQAYSEQGDALTRCKKRNPQTVREFSDQSSRD